MIDGVVVVVVLSYCLSFSVFVVALFVGIIMGLFYCSLPVGFYGTHACYLGSAIRGYDTTYKPDLR